MKEVTIEQLKKVFELLRDQGFVNADDETELDYVTELAFNSLDN